MRVLVTGGAGFLGSNLCRFLIGKGDEVVCLDNLFTGRKENVGDLIDNSKFKLIIHDIINPIEVDGDFDRIYNLACPASPVHYQSDPVATLLANTKGVINILEFARVKSARVLQASTSETYGDPLEHPQKESYRGNVSSIGPRACYDEGKRVAETFFMDYSRKFKIPIRIVRIFNTYGPSMDVQDGRVVSNFIVQALRGEQMSVYGDGKQTRSFCYVDDLIRGIHGLMESDYALPVNLGNPGEFTILELVDKIKTLTGSSSEVIFKELPVDDPVKRKPDITLARDRLNWEPKVELDEGLGKTIEYFKSKIQN